MRLPPRRWSMPMALAIAIAPLSADQLKPQTLAAWDQYIRLTEARQAAELDGTEPFLWIDRLSEVRREEHMAALKDGKVVVEKLATLDGGNPIEVKEGLLHHWIGTVFVPDTPIARMTQVVQDYDHYAERFGPTITRARIVRREGSRFEVHMRTHVKKVISVTQDQEWAIEYRTISPTRLFVPSRIARLYDVVNADTPAEKRTPGDEGEGWLWRLHNYCAFEQRAEGTYEQCESISLTRPIPWYAKLFVSGYVNTIPKETLETTLGQVRATFVRLP